METWLCPNFLSLPKKSELRKIWGGGMQPPSLPRSVRLCESHSYLELHSTNSYPRNQLNQGKREKKHVQINSKIWPAFIYTEEKKITITIRIQI